MHGVMTVDLGIVRHGRCLPLCTPHTGGGWQTRCSPARGRLAKCQAGLPRGLLLPRAPPARPEERLLQLLLPWPWFWLEMQELLVQVLVLVEGSVPAYAAC